MPKEIEVLDVDGSCGAGVGSRHRIEYDVWGDGPPQIVLLHDGLGSVAQWRDVPERIAGRCETTVLAYNRPGHGASEPVPSGPWPAGWLHDQARLLGLLLTEWDAVTPLLVGHSDGASIALIHAAEAAAPPSCRGVVSLAAHSFVEPICGEAIARLQQTPAKMEAALAPFHRHPAALFEAWSGVWQSDDFASWDIRPLLGQINVPTWIVQGDGDEYGTEAQVRTAAAAIGGTSKSMMLPGLGHLLHHENPDAVVGIVASAWQAT